MTEVEDWLRRKLRSAPPELLETMITALPAAETDSLADQLATAALALYRDVAEGSGRREDALPLLAADALFTHAFEVQAERAPSDLTAFAARWGARGRLAEVTRP